MKLTPRHRHLVVALLAFGLAHHAIGVERTPAAAPGHTFTKDRSQATVLLPGPTLLAPAGSSTPGFKWKSIGSAPGSLSVRSATFKSDALRRAEEITPPALPTHAKSAAPPIESLRLETKLPPLPDPLGISR